MFRLFKFALEFPTVALRLSFSRATKRKLPTTKQNDPLRFTFEVELAIYLVSPTSLTFRKKAKGPYFEPKVRLDDYLTTEVSLA